MKTWRGVRLTGAELFLIGLAVLVLLFDAFMLIMTVIVTLTPDLRAHESVSPGRAWQACLIIGTLSGCYIRMVLRHLDQRCC